MPKFWKMLSVRYGRGDRQTLSIEKLAFNKLIGIKDDSSVESCHKKHCNISACTYIWSMAVLDSHTDHNKSP